MKVFSPISKVPARPRRALTRIWGFTVIEVMVSLGILALGTMGGISAFMFLNRYTANLRALTQARELCQERIEQALTLPFRPTGLNLAVPSAPNSDPTTNSLANTPNFNILGALTNYNATTGAFTGGTNLQTSLVGTTPETIPIYTQADGTSARGSGNVVFTRSTTVSQAPLTYSTVSLNVVQFTVTVSYVAYGKTYTVSQSTLRGPD